jgi:hypothetical protein
MDPLNRLQRKGCLDEAHLLCCARKAYPLALNCSCSVFGSTAISIEEEGVQSGHDGEEL